MGKYSEHSTYINKKEVEVPSVTTIIKLLNKPFIAKWANSLGWKRQSYDKVLEESANKGTFVHETLHEYLFKEGKKFDLSNPEVLNFLYENLNTFKEFEKDYDIKPIWGEKSFSLDKFGGTVDLYCELDNKYTILDFKTSKRFYSSHFIQLGAYIQLLEANDYKVEQVAILRIREGDYDIKIINREDMNDYIELFNRLVEVFYLVYELNEEWGDLL
jgi:ATP-dependent exoDNAse (exonuclease V) beta subunit